MDPSRRSFLRGRPLRTGLPTRPPGASQADVDAGCTACGACVSACPSGIILRGESGLPEVRFEHGECTFCDACARACPEPVFAGLPSALGFEHTVAIGDRCLTRTGIYCQTCSDVCPEVALSFEARPGGVPRPRLAVDLCSGCGACIAACPADAVTVHHRQREPANA